MKASEGSACRRMCVHLTLLIAYDNQDAVGNCCVLRGRIVGGVPMCLVGRKATKDIVVSSCNGRCVRAVAFSCAAPSPSPCPLACGLWLGGCPFGGSWRTGPPCMADVDLRHRSVKSQRVWHGVGPHENLLVFPACRKFTQDILGLSCSGRCVCVLLLFPV